MSIISIILTLLIRLLGVDDPRLRQRLGIKVSIKTGPVATRYPVPLNTILWIFKEETIFSFYKKCFDIPFCDNCRNLRALIGWFFIVNKQTDTWFYTMYAIRPRARADNLTICYCKKQIVVSFSCVCPVIDNEFRHNIVKVVLWFTQLSPRGSTATLTMLWRNSWSITEGGEQVYGSADLVNILARILDSERNFSGSADPMITADHGFIQFLGPDFGF